MNACQVRAGYWIMGPDGSTESRTMTAARADATSTQAPLLILRRDLRQFAPDVSTSIGDIKALLPSSYKTYIRIAFGVH